MRYYYRVRDLIYPEEEFYYTDMEFKPLTKNTVYVYNRDGETRYGDAHTLKAMIKVGRQETFKHEYTLIDSEDEWLLMSVK